MTLKELLIDRLPQNLAGPNGNITIYTIAAAIGYRPQSVAEWFRKDQITIPCIELLMKIEGHCLTLADFGPFCPDLRSVLDMQNAESQGPGDEY